MRTLGVLLLFLFVESIGSAAVPGFTSDELSESLRQAQHAMAEKVQTSNCELVKQLSSQPVLTLNPIATKINHILVDKENHYMHLVQDGIVVRSYHLSLGFQPSGAKEKEGDGKTPEGLYFVEAKKSDSRYHLAMRVSYPTPQQEVKALEEGYRPGGDIMIHGLPNDVRGAYKSLLPQVDWTQGCMAVTDSEIEEIYNLVEVGTWVEICK